MSSFSISKKEVIEEVYYKPCKKRSDFYSESMPTDLLKRPYKYNFKLVAGEGADLSEANLRISLVYANGEEVTEYGALKNVDGWKWKEDLNAFVVGPLYFTICSYKHSNRGFRLQFEVEQDGESLCKIVTRSFLIRAKRPRRETDNFIEENLSEKRMRDSIAQGNHLSFSKREERRKERYSLDNVLEGLEKPRKMSAKKEKSRSMLAPIQIPQNGNSSNSKIALFQALISPSTSQPSQSTVPSNPFHSDSVILSDNLQAERLFLEYRLNNDRFTPINAQLPVFPSRSKEYYQSHASKMASPLSTQGGFFQFEEDPFAFVNN